MIVEQKRKTRMAVAAEDALLKGARKSVKRSSMDPKTEGRGMAPASRKVALMAAKMRGTGRERLSANIQGIRLSRHCMRTVRRSRTENSFLSCRIFLASS